MSQHQADAAVEVEGLTKTFDDERAVDDLTFRVEWNEVTGFLGPNGAGKSTTLKVILGLMGPTAGTARVAGREYVRLSEPGRAVGALLETQQFHPLRRARDHLLVYTAAIGLDDRRADEVLDLVELGGAARKKLGSFSLGMKQRLGLATALLGDPHILILDEPANGLDPAGMRWLRSFLRGFAGEGRAVLVSSHLLGEVSQIADQVVVIDHGRLVVQAKTSELIARARDGATLEDVFLDLTGSEAIR